MIEVLQSLAKDYMIMLGIVGVFILLDIITGVLQAVYNNTMESSIMRKGLFHKCGTLLALVFGFLLNAITGYIDLGVNVPAAQIITAYIVIMESKSIIENLGKVSDDIGNLAKRIFPKDDSE